MTPRRPRKPTPPMDGLTAIAFAREAFEQLHRPAVVALVVVPAERRRSGRRGRLETLDLPQSTQPRIPSLAAPCHQRRVPPSHTDTVPPARS